LVPALALGAGLVGTPDVITDRVEQYSGLGIELLMLHFHPMLEGLHTFIDRIMPRLRRSTGVEPVGRRMA
jgi:dimethylsulfone monooxygenase